MLYRWVRFNGGMVSVLFTVNFAFMLIYYIRTTYLVTYLSTTFLLKYLLLIAFTYALYL